MYRPEGWDETEHTITVDNEWVRVVATSEKLAYEAGADAMLKGLKKEGDYCNPCSLQKHWGKKGYLVFIPEK